MTYSLFQCLFDIFQYEMLSNDTHCIFLKFLNGWMDAFMQINVTRAHKWICRVKRRGPLPFFLQNIPSPWRDPHSQQSSYTTR